MRVGIIYDTAQLSWQYKRDRNLLRMVI
jgi:hypothetical protein